MRETLLKLYLDGRDLCGPYLHRPAPAFGFLALTAVAAAFPHRQNNSFRKLVTFALIVSWITLTFTIAFDVAAINQWIYAAFTGVTMLVYGQMWEIEKYRVAVGPLEIIHDDSDDD